MKLKKHALRFFTITFLASCSLMLQQRDSLQAEVLPKVSETSEAWKIISHHLLVQLDIEKHLLNVTDTLTVLPGQDRLDLFLNSSFRVHSVFCDSSSQKLKFYLSKDYDLSEFYSSITDDIEEGYENASLLTINVPRRVAYGKKQITITISYEGKLYDPPGTTEFSRQKVADQTTGIIGEEGVYLSEASHWYPTRPRALSTFRMEVTLPSSYEVISEGDFAGRSVDGECATIIWDVPYPTEALHLVAGKYVITKSRYEEIEVSTYFFPEEQGLSEQYITAVKRYLKMYEEMIGKYPYKKFAVVENFFSTGYGMPSFTLLGREVIRLPFIVSTSLGHEVAHNWWGNSVFVDYETGNWCEGLTTYLADYHYKELESEKEAEQYRREICRDYTNYVAQSGEDFPLTYFHQRTTPATRAIGYGKSLMIFHMLRKLVGSNLFYDTLKEFYCKSAWRYASWKDIRDVFEEKSGKDLGWFFKLWVEKSGAPILRLENPSYRMKEDGYHVAFDIIQEPNCYLSIPYEIQTEDGPVSAGSLNPAIPGTVQAEIGADYGSVRTHYEVLVGSLPLSLSVDPHQEVFRKLHPEEIPPILSGVLGDRGHLIVILHDEDQSLQAAYAEIAGSLSRTGEARIVKLEDLTDDDLRRNSILILGNASNVKKFKDVIGAFPETFSLLRDSFTLNGRTYGRDSSVLFTVKNPWNSSKTIAIFAGFNPDPVKTSGRKLPHYGKYSFLSFTLGENKDKGILPVASSPLIHRFPPRGSDSTR
ncbi:MAG: M1 family aminopeptidase [Acidobacteriota bacterium]